MKRYRIKVTEKHTDFVWVEAETHKEAESKAPDLSECEFESLYSSEFTGDTEEVKHIFNRGARQ